MNDRLGILFLHHDNNPTMRKNLAAIKAHNGDAVVVTMSAGKPFRGGYTIQDTPDLQDLHSIKPNRSSDWLVCSWVKQRSERCDKWWIVEWDTYVRVSVRSYYAEVWKQPFVASSVRLRYREPEWIWFAELEKLPPDYRAFAVGAVPFIYLVSDHVLRCISNTLLESPITAGNGELRFATAANKCGYPPCGFSPPNDRISWMNWERMPDEKAIFHPVKHVPKRR